MHLLVILLLAALVVAAAGLALPGLSGVTLPAGATALAAALLLLLRAIPRRRGPAAPASGPQTGPQTGPREPRNRRPPAAKPAYILIDGSNVMFWKDETPRMETLREVARHLTGLGYTPGVIFDASAGHRLAGRYMHAGDFGTALGLPRDRVFVVDKGNPADLTLLAASRDLDARIVTNDRYREWAGRHPEVLEPGFLIRGGYRGGELWLDLEAAS